MSIPNFPEFVPLDMSLKEELVPFFKNISSGMCENTFASLILYSSYFNYRISRYSDLTLIVTCEPKNNEPFFYIIGKFLPAVEYIELCSSPAMEKYRIMRNAPAEIVPQYGEELCKAGFTVELDRDNCDYLYSRNDLALLKGKAFHKKKNLVNQFLKLYDKDVRELDDLTTKDAFSVLDKWKQHRLEEGGDDGDFEQCTLALKNRVFLDLKGIVVYAGGIPSGFCLGEFSSDEKMFICHFEKGIPKVQGIYQAVNKFTAEWLPESVELINWEQDLGDEGLRHAKMSYRPCAMLEKYLIYRGEKCTL